MGDSRQRARDVRVLIGLGILFAFLLAASWERWTLPIIDHGREMNLPARIAAGDALYLDVQFLYGPFAPWFNAALYRVFGVRLGVLHAAGAVCAVLIILLIYRIARCLMGPYEAGAAAGLVLVLCALRSTANYISPYAYASLYGLLFALGSLASAVRYWDTGRSAWIALAGAAAGLSLISKWELALAALTAGAAAVALRSLEDKAFRWRDAIGFAFPAAAITVVAFGFAASRASWKMLVEENHILFSSMPPQLVYFNQQISGIGEWPHSFWYTLSGVGMLFVWAGILTMLGALPRAKSGEGGRLLRLGLRMAVAGGGAWVILRWTFGVPADATILTGMPVVLPLFVVLLAVQVYQSARSGEGIGFQRGALLMTALFAQASILRVILKVKTTGPYTPFFIPVLLVVCVWLLVVLLPAAVAVGNPELRRNVRRAATIVLAVFVAGSAISSSVRFRRHNTFEVRTDRGGFLTDPLIGEPLAAAIAYVRSNTSETDAVLSLPQATTINFLAGRRHPFREEIVHPGFLTDEEGIRRLEADPPELILVVNLLTPEFRDRAFGADYNVKLMRWIDQRYRQTARFDSEASRGAQLGDAPFFILVYESIAKES